MAQHDIFENRLVVLIGGSGFLGTHVAQDLLRRGARLRVAGRNPEGAFRLKPLAGLGQLQFARCDVTKRDSIANALQGADAVVYLVGTFGAKAQELQADGAGIAAAFAAQQGATAFTYVSAIGADPQSDSAYARTKGDGERQVLASFPDATILRPSILFGEDDNFINMFARLISQFPILPVFGADARLQPLWVDDAAAAIVAALADPQQHGGKTYELAGPDVVTMGEINRRLAAAQGRDRRFWSVPDGLAGLFARLPGTPMGPDQWKLLQRGSVATGTVPGIADLGVTPHPLSLFLERWMLRYRKAGRFGVKTETA
ncbi:complex I NDUFA9 subunit family protein [Croceibacterium ferulae]|uniref:complex I NDUFA9 subunit family protein n=1 Tax=Croceibacterium ferulae TaxID=1854641 RepID=UPI000EB45ED5|nr:complex I NDUFA9 subunit family protein [Croceibacterium ferulae]